jgi:AbrB family looped-hinge helix DNA binding protein
VTVAGAASRVTAQNQTSVPADVRKRLGIGPGSELYWEIRGDTAVVSARRSTLDAIHRITARRKVKRAGLSEIRKGIIAGATSGRR